MVCYLCVILLPGACVCFTDFGLFVLRPLVAVLRFKVVWFRIPCVYLVLICLVWLLGLVVG